MSEYQIKVTADTKAALAELRKLSKQIEDVNKPKIKPIVDSNSLASLTKGLQTELRRLKEHQVTIDINSTSFKQLGAQIQDTQNRLRGLEQKKLLINADPSSIVALRAKLGDLQQQLERVSTKSEAFKRLTGEIKKTEAALSGVGSAGGGGAMRLVENFSKVGLALYGVQQAVRLTGAAFKGFFDETIGREIQFRETILKTQTTLASTNKVFRNGSEITDPYQKIVALTGQVEERVDSIRKRSIELAGVTSNDVVEVFAIVSSQIGMIGGGLKEAEELALSFSAALGTFGLPLHQARQEIGSILRGDITKDSYMAKALGITSEDVERARTQAGGVVAFIQNKLEGAVAGQKIAAQSFSGVMSNLKDLQELFGQEFGKGLLDPMLGGLRTVFNYLNSIRDTLFAIGREAGAGIGELLGNNLSAIVGGSDLFQGMGASAAEGAKQFVTVIQQAFASLQADANEFIAPVRNILEELVKSAGVLLSAFLELGKALASIGVESLKSLASLFSNLSEVVTVIATGLAGVLKVLTALVQLPPVMVLAQLAAQVAILNKLGITQMFAGAIGPIRNMSTAVVGLSQNLIRSGVSLKTFTSAAVGMGAAVSAAVVSMGRAVAGFMKANAYMIIIQVTLAVVIDLFGRFQRQQEELARTQKAEAALQELNTKFRDVGESATEAEKAQKAYLESLVSNEYDAAVNNLNEINEKLRLQAGPNIFEKLGNSVKWFAGELDKLLRKFGPLLALISGGAIGGGTLGAIAGKQPGRGSKSTDNKIFGFDTRNITDPMGRHSKTGWYQQDLLRQQREAAARAEKFKLNDKAAGTGSDDIRLQAEENRANIERQKQLESDLAERRHAFEEDLANFRKSQEDAVFERRQSLAQKEIDIFRAAGELRIAQMEQANAKLLEGEEGASRAAMEALNTYITEREKGELNIEAQKKEMAIELVNMEKTLADYRLEQEKRIAEIRRKADQYAFDIAKANAQIASSGAMSAGSSGTGGVTAVSGGKAFDSGLRTGPAHLIGGSAEYHQDMAFGTMVSLKEQVALVRQMAQEYDKIGRKMELSNNGVAGKVFPVNGSEAEQTEWVTSARAAHRARNGGTGRDAIDFYTPLKGTNRYHKSVEDTPMLAPVIPGAEKQYFSGGAAGAGMRLVKNGQKMFSLIHGRTDRALPQNGMLPASIPAQTTATASARPPQSTANANTITGKEQFLIGELIRRGFKDVQVAAIMGSAMQESTLNPSAREKGGAGLGLFQWTDSFRRNQVPALTGNFQTDAKNQLDLFQKELASTESVAGTALKKANTLQEAGAAMKQYERYGKAGNRYKYMEEYHNRIKSGNLQGAPSSGAPNAPGGTSGGLNIPLPEYGSTVDNPQHMRTITDLENKLVASTQKLADLRASLADIGNSKNFEAIGKAFEQALPGKEDFEAMESEMFGTMQTIAALGTATNAAFDPEASKLTVEHAKNRMIAERELAQMGSHIAGDTRLTDQERVKMQETLNGIAAKYNETQARTLELKQQQLGAERALAYIQETQQRTQQLKQSAGDNRKRAEMRRSGMRQEDIDYQMQVDAINRDYEEQVKGFSTVNPMANKIGQAFNGSVDTSFLAPALPANNIVPTTGKSTPSTTAATTPSTNPLTALTNGFSQNIVKVEAAMFSAAATASGTLGPALNAALSPESLPTLLGDLSKIGTEMTDPSGGLRAQAGQAKEGLFAAAQSDYESARALNSPILQLVGQWRQELADTEGMVASLSGTIQSELSGAMSTSLIGLVNGTNTAKEAFGSMFQSIGKTMVDTATQMLSKSLMTGLMGGGAPGGGLLGSIFGLGGGGGGGLGSLLGGLFGARAAGGNADANRPLLIGERGPEIFVPDTGGQIVPNHRSQAYAAMSRPVDDGAFPVTQKGSTNIEPSDPFAANKKILDSIASVSQKRNADKSLSAIGGSAEIKYSRVNSGDLPFITEDDALRIAKQAEMNGAKMGQQRTLAALRNNPSTRRGIGI